MSRKVIIDPEELLWFVEELAVDISEWELGNIFPQIMNTKKLKKALPRLSSRSALLGLAMGLVLANYQPELAAVAVKQMEEWDLSSAENLLKSVLFYYQRYKKGGREVRPGDIQFVEISNWDLSFIIG